MNNVDTNLAEINVNTGYKFINNEFFYSSRVGKLDLFD